MKYVEACLQSFQFYRCPCHLQAHGIRAKEKEAATESSSNIPRSKNRPKYDFPLKLGITAVLSSSFLFFHMLTLASQLQNLAAYQKIRYRNNTKNQYIALQLIPRLHHSMSNIQHINGCINPCGNMIFQLHLTFHSDPLHNLFKLITSQTLIMIINYIWNRLSLIMGHHAYGSLYKRYLN